LKACKKVCETDGKKCTKSRQREFRTTKHKMM